MIDATLITNAFKQFEAESEVKNFAPHYVSVNVQRASDGRVIMDIEGRRDNMTEYVSSPTIIVPEKE
jgi:hypothetical protein